MLCSYIQVPNVSEEGVKNTPSLNGRRTGWGIGRCVVMNSSRELTAEEETTWSLEVNCNGSIVSFFFQLQYFLVLIPGSFGIQF